MISRIALLKRMADKIWETDESAYIILEHFADAVRRKRTQSRWHDGLGKQHVRLRRDLLTGNTSANNNQPKDLNRVSYTWKVDEERSMVKALNSAKSTTYSVANELTALNRVKLDRVFIHSVQK
jgi:hypothetical protein